MPRAARLVLPKVPHHVTQRGNRRQPTFLCEADYALYLDLLRFWSRKAETRVWAWCLMPNHVHIVLVPSGPDGLRATFAPLHRRYSWEINRREGWHGHLWQTRFGSFPMDEAHVYACLRYVELNPQRGRLVARPEQWAWSSARAHLGLAADGLIDLDAARARVDDWRAFLDEGLDEQDLKAIRAAERSGRLRLAPPRAEGGCAG
jgi:putative transposase